MNSLSVGRGEAKPAAGLNTRFLPVTKFRPKKMLSKVDKSTLSHIIEKEVNVIDEVSLAVE